jgi:hypothetical protein
MHIIISHKNLTNVQWAGNLHFDFFEKINPKGKIWIYFNT